MCRSLFAESPAMIQRIYTGRRRVKTWKPQKSCPWNKGDRRPEVCSQLVMTVVPGSTIIGDRARQIPWCCLMVAKNMRSLIYIGSTAIQMRTDSPDGLYSVAVCCSSQDKVCYWFILMKRELVGHLLSLRSWGLFFRRRKEYYSDQTSTIMKCNNLFRPPLWMGDVTW